MVLKVQKTMFVTRNLNMSKAYVEQIYGFAMFNPTGIVFLFYVEAPFPPHPHHLLASRLIN